MLFVLSGNLLREQAAQTFLVGTQGFAALVGDAAGGTREASQARLRHLNVASLL